MSGSVRKTTTSLKKVMARSTIAYFVFEELFVLFCIGGTLLLAFVAFAVANPELSPFDTNLNIVSFVLLLVSLTIWGTIFYIAKSIFKGIEKGQSPFNYKHAKQMRFLGCLFVGEFVLSFSIPCAFYAISHIGLFNIGYAASQITSYSVIPIDVNGLIGAVICFVLSTIWHYGTLLQIESDGTF